MRDSVHAYGGAVLIACVVIALASVGQAHSENEASTTHKVLVLHSYHEGLTWTDGENQGIRDALACHKGVALSIEHLDSKRFPLSAISKPFAEFLAQKYVSTSFDAIIVSDNNALTFLSENRAILFPDAPVVFCGINNFAPDMLQKFNGLSTGVIQTLDPEGNIDLILRLQPKLRDLAVVSGTTPTAQAIRKRSRPC